MAYQIIKIIHVNKYLASKQLLQLLTNTANPESAGTFRLSRSACKNNDFLSKYLFGKPFHSFITQCSALLRGVAGPISAPAGVTNVILKKSEK